MKYFYQTNSRPKVGWRAICGTTMLVVMLLFGTTTIAHATQAPRGEVAQTKSVENTLISLKVGPTSLKNILEKIKTQDIQIIYNDENVSPYTNLSVNVTNSSVASILATALANTRLEYTVVDDVIAIRAKEDSSKNTASSSTNTTKYRRTLNALVFDKESSEPITGASVVIPEYGVGDYTLKGRTSISFSTEELKNLTVRVSMLGMKTQDVTWKVGDDRIIVSLESDAENIEDIVVTGYAKIDKASFTGSTTTITNEQMMQISPTNPLAALQVFDPSLRMVENSTMGSDPNTMPEFYIRGQSGISGTSELDQLTSDDISEFSLVSNPNLPIFILDGYEVSMEYVYDMDPMRIQSMTILKDAASTAIYGSRAANGVIVIETIPPQPGKLRVSYSFTGTVTAPDLSSYSLMNAQEKLDLDLAAGILDPYFMYPYYMEFYRNNLNNVQQGVDTYWLSQPLQTQFNQAHSIYVDGGEESLRFGLGVRYENQNGVMKGSFRDNISADLKVDYRMNDKLQVTNTTTFSNTSSEDSPYGDFSDYTSMLPYWSPYDLETGELVESYANIYAGTTANPLYAATLGSFSTSGYYNLNNNLGVNYFFLDNFQLKFQLSVGYTQSESLDFTSPDDPEFDAEANSSSVSPSTAGRLTTYNSSALSWSSNLYVMYNKSIGEHNMNFTMGMNASSSNSNSEYATYTGFASSSLWQPQYASDISSKPSFSDNITRLVGGFLMGNYTFKNTYLFDISLRFDGSSEFGTDERIAPFWSFGTGVNLHQYDAFQEIKDVVNMARVTINYGQTGKLNFSPYMARSTYETETDRWYSTGIGSSLIAMGNSSLGWEKTNTLNIATDWGFFNNRIVVGLAYYDKITNNLLTDMSLPASSGFTTYKINLGKVSNRGYEINLNVTPYKTKDMDVNLMITAAHNKNEILEISDAMKAYNDSVNQYYDDNYYNGSNSPMLQYVEGASLSSIFGVQSLGISPATGQELYLTKDGEITDTWSSADQVVIGCTEPVLQGALGLNVRYKKLTLYASFIYEMGGDAYNTTLINNIDNADILNSNVDIRVMDRWLNPGDISAYKELKFVSAGTTQPTSRFVQKNNYLKFNSISMGYTVDANWLKAAGVSMCRLQATMNDLFTYSSIDQERGLSYPYARTFSLSINLSF